MPQTLAPATSTITAAGAEYGIWIPHNVIHARIANLAAHIAQKYKGKRVRLTAILQGAKPFHTLLVEELRTIPDGPAAIETDALCAKSYTGTQSGTLRWLQHPKLPARADTHEIIVEDIVDSGRTIAAIQRYMQERGTASVCTAVLLNRPEARDPAVDFTPDIVAFEISNPDAWAIGFGMDLDETYRDLPDIYGKLPASGELPPYQIPAL